MVFFLFKGEGGKGGVCGSHRAGLVFGLLEQWGVWGGVGRVAGVIGKRVYCRCSDPSIHPSIH
jgi:hypothetical protein